MPDFSLTMSQNKTAELFFTNAKVRYLPGAEGWDEVGWLSPTPIPSWYSGIYKTTGGFRAVGTIEPAAFNNNIGGQIEINVNRNGISTGTIKIGGATGTIENYRFIKGFDSEGKLDVTVKRRSGLDLKLSLQLDISEAPSRFLFPADGNNTITVAGEKADISANSVSWNAKNPATAYQGYYTVGLLTSNSSYGKVKSLTTNITISTEARTGGWEAVGNKTFSIDEEQTNVLDFKSISEIKVNDNVLVHVDGGNKTLLIRNGNYSTLNQKQGHGFLTFTVTPATGAVSLKGVLADGAKVTGSSVVDSKGVVPMWLPLYSSNGSLFGSLTINSTKSVAADLSYTIPAGVTKSPNPNGFKAVPLSAIVGSGEYEKLDIKDGTGKYGNLDVKDFKLTFTDVSSSFDQFFKVNKDNGQISPEPTTVKNVNGTWNLGTGLFQGTFQDSTFQGVILNRNTTVFKLYGNFQSKNGTSYLSGKVEN